MKREDIVKAFEMRMEGKALQEIGDHFGVSREYIRQVLQFNVNGHKRGIADSIYPNITKWALENNMSAYQLNNEIGLCRHVHAFYAKLRGKTRFSVDDIRKIMDYTGMSFEEVTFTQAGDD